MLTKLKIANYALIEALSIDFSPGFSVITGETGAGKSVLLGALALILGERASAKSITRGEKKCIVEATFSHASPELKAFLAENDLDYHERDDEEEEKEEEKEEEEKEEEEEIIIRREITASGKSRAFVNDTPVPPRTLSQISTLLIDIHSQHQNLLLGEENFLLGLLDAIAGNEKLLADYKTDFSTWQNLKAQLAELREQAKQESAEADYLRFQLQQLDEAQLEADEEEALEEEVEFLSHAEDVKAALYGAESLLQGEEGNLLDKLRQVVSLLQAAGRSHSLSTELAERTLSASIELKDIAGEVATALERADCDPQRLEQAGARLQTIYDLKRKHRAESTRELLQIADTLRERLSLADNADALICEKEAAISRLEEKLSAYSERLRAARTKAGILVSKEACTHLQQLGMQHCTASFDLQDKALFSINGKDKVTLLFSANKNVPPANVADIASGGEVARLMLTLKNILSRHVQLPTIVFDEIDTGVSGKMAEKMARAMQEMATHCQVICITHLPQIAAAGSHHYKVHKEQADTATTTHITKLHEDERIEELSKMLSGENVTQAAISNAKALLSEAQLSHLPLP